MQIKYYSKFKDNRKVYLEKLLELGRDSFLYILENCLFPEKNPKAFLTLLFVEIHHSIKKLAYTKDTVSIDDYDVGRSDVDYDDKNPYSDTTLTIRKTFDY